MLARRFWSASRSGVAALSLALLTFGSAWAQAPAPLLAKGQPSVAWWFAFKFNSASFPACPAAATRACLFGGQVQTSWRSFSQQYAVASNESKSLQAGTGCIGDTTDDPVGATFDEIYNGSFNYVVWNDQFQTTLKLAATLPLASDTRGYRFDAHSLCSEPSGG